MNHEQTIQALDELKASGGDINAIVSYASALASTGKTPLGLNQWQRSDKPVMEDFNEDNRIIDDNLSRLWANKANIESPAFTGTATINNLAIATVQSPKWHTLNVTEHYTGVSGPYCCKTGAGIVFVCGVVSRQNVPLAGEVIATLQTGYRPSYAHPIHITASRGSSGSWATYGYITSSGEIQFHTGGMPAGWVTGVYMAFSTSFPVAV